MSDLTECCDCGNFYPTPTQRQTMAGLRHMAPDDCREAEYEPACPLCHSMNLAEAVFDARDCLRHLQRTFPNRHVRVVTQSHSQNPRGLTVTLWLGDCRLKAEYSQSCEERLGQVFRRALASATARFSKPKTQAVS